MDDVDDRLAAAHRARGEAIREQDELEADVGRAREAAGALGRSARWPRLVMVAGAATWLGSLLGTQAGWPWGLRVCIACCVLLSLLAPRLELRANERDERRAMALAEALRLHAQGARVRIERVRRAEPEAEMRDTSDAEVEIGVSRRRGRKEGAR